MLYHVAFSWTPPPLTVMCCFVGPNIPSVLHLQTSTPNILWLERHAHMKLVKITFIYFHLYVIREVQQNQKILNWMWAVIAKLKAENSFVNAVFTYYRYLQVFQVNPIIVRLWNRYLCSRNLHCKVMTCKQVPCFLCGNFFHAFLMSNTFSMLLFKVLIYFWPPNYSASINLNLVCPTEFQCFRLSWVLILASIEEKRKVLSINLLFLNSSDTCNIWDFHGGDYEKFRILGCDAV
jgi:hypothetical protein